MLSTFRLPCLAAFSQCVMVMLLLTTLTEGRAQIVSVTFNVNMANVADPDVPHIAGGSDFGVPGDNPMSDQDGDNIWTLTVELPTGYTGYYTFTNGACPDWSCKENIAGQDCAHPENYNDRRLENITENTVINTCFGQCTTDGSCAPVGGPVPVTFQVDMSDENTDSGVYMSGTFDGWCGCTPMDDADGDGVYSTTIDCMPGGFLWKFMIGGWGGEEQFEPGGICTQTTNEFTNRYIEVEEGASAIELEAYCFNSCEACNGDDDGSADNTFAVTFNVNTENITVGPNGMFLGAGSFGDAQAYAMSDTDGDGTYSVTVNVDAGLISNYIFLNSPNHGGDWGAKENLGGLSCSDPNNFDDRILGPVNENMTISTCFGECSTDGTCEALPATSAITFQVDMSQYPGDYGMVNLNGSFNGWCGDCIPLDDSDGDGVYAVTVDLLPDTVEYKFTLDGWTAQEEFFGGESCTSTIDGYTNRSYIVDGGATLPVVCFNSCEACEPEFEGTTVTDIIAGSPDHFVLNAMLDSTGLDEALSGEGPFTLFAPTDAAFDAIDPFVLLDLLTNNEALTEILTYHVIGGIALSADLSNGQIITMVNGTDVAVSIMNGNLMINDATITVADIIADNGVVHVIDVVLMPDPTLNYTVMDILGDSPDHGLLHELTNFSEEVYDIFSGGGTVTLFAPTDAAFAALDMDFFDELFSGNGTGEDLLFWHFMDGVLMSEEFYDGLTLNTGGGDLTLEVDNGVVTVNNATVVVADIEASNGVIHIIDAVLDLGCSDPEACNYDSDAWSGTATCVYAENCDFCLDGMVVDGDADDDGVCDEDEVAGCTDPSAWNFNPEATDSDAASCVYLPGGCESIGNDNWNAVGLGVHPAELELMFGVEIDEELVLHVPEVLPEPASGALFGVLDFTPTGVSGVPEGLDIGWTADVMEAGTQACLPMTGMPLETGTFTVVWTGDMVFSVFGSPLPVGDFSFEQALTVLPNPNPISGCTYSGSSNFNPVANVDDGGCLFEGCTDPEADNHHPLFNVDDGSCVYGGLGPGDGLCPADLNGDDLVGVGDLLILLGEFGIVCP